MVKIRRYPTNGSYPRWSVFAAAERNLLISLGDGLHERRELKTQLLEFREALGRLSPYAYRAAADEIRIHAHLYRSRRGHGRIPNWNWLARYRRERHISSTKWNFDWHVQCEKHLPFLLLFHGDGYRRELALTKIDGPLQSSIEVIALADLANNWVAPVRHMALRAIERSYPHTDPAHLAESYSFILENKRFWSRWDKQTSRKVAAFFNEPNIVEILAQRLEQGEERRASRTLQRCLRTGEIDSHLESIWTNSTDASLRAVALKALLQREAVWIKGFTWKWVDKSLGQRNRVPVFDRRVLTVLTPRKPLITAGLCDRAAQVRKVAAQGVIDFGDDLEIEIGEIAKILVLDKSQGVRRRGEYLMQKHDANPSI